MADVCPPCVERELVPKRKAAARATRVLVVAFGVCATLAAIQVLSFVAQAQLGSRMAVGDYTNAEIDANDARVNGLGLVDLVFEIFVAATFCVWMNRTHRASPPSMSEFGPNAWGWFFAPVLSLWKPYQAVTALYTSRADGAPPPALFPAWWGFFLLRNILGTITSRIPAPSDPDGLVSYSWTFAFSEIVTLVAAYLALCVVRSVADPKPGLERTTRDEI